MGMGSGAAAVGTPESVSTTVAFAAEPAADTLPVGGGVPAAVGDGDPLATGVPVWLVVGVGLRDAVSDALPVVVLVADAVARADPLSEALPVADGGAALLVAVALGDVVSLGARVD